MKLFLILYVILSSTLLTGCIDLASNDSKNRQIILKKISRAKGEVYTMRGGLGGIFSKGMNRLQDTLTYNYQIYATSTVWYKASALSHFIIEDNKHKKVQGPIILIGHSLGANEQIKVARNLNRAHIPVALLMTVDAVSPLTVPPNVKHVFNIYTPSFIPMFSGLKLKAMEPELTKIENVNVASVKIDVNHFTIDGNKTIQQIMLDQVLKALNKNYVCKTNFC